MPTSSTSGTRQRSDSRRKRATPGTRALAFHPLVPERWSDLERLFGARGACGGCWCMWWRLPRAEFARRKGQGNRRTLRRIVDTGDVPGILAYAGDEPVGWCSVAPRDDFPVLEHSRTLKRVDERPVWSVVCFFVARPFRRRGVSVRLLKAAADHVRRNGGELLEGYPVEPRTRALPDAFAWTGLARAFRAAGFEEVARRSPSRPIMRLTVGKRPPTARRSLRSPRGRAP
jgi:GNAT superfamily N-acetyltransferase